MAGDAELGFGVLHAGAQGDRSPAGCIGEPGVAHVDQEVHACAHRIVWIFIRRQGILIRMQLISRVIRRHPHVIFLPRLKNAGAELVEARIILGRLNLINKLSVVEWDHIRLSVGVLARPEDLHVERYVAIRHIQHEVNQPGLRLVEGEPEPLEPLNHRCVSIFTLRWSVGALVIAAEYGLPQFERLGVLPRTVGRRSDEAPLKISYTAGPGSCTLENLAEGRANLRSLRSGS